MANDDVTKYKSILAGLESGAEKKPYKAINRLGYLGKYQFGNLALQDLGYKNKKGNWTGKNKITSKEDFLNNPTVQENALTDYIKIQRGYLKSKGALKHIGKTFQGIPITESGLIGAAHLVGAGSVNKMLTTGKIPKDANKTKATDYLKKLANSIIPGAEGAELNEENMARFKRLDEREKEKEKEQKKSKAPSPELTASFLSSMDKNLGIEAKEEQQIPFRSTEIPLRRATEAGVEDRETIPEEDKLEDPPQNEKEEERKGMEDGFRDALLYFGPRLGALLVGGTDALDITDKTLKGFEESKSKKKMSPFEEASIDIKRESMGAQQQAARAQSIEEAEQADYLKTEQLEIIDETLTNFADLEKKLKESSNITGPISSWILGPLYKAADSDEANTQRMLKEIGVDALLDKVARTKGAISNKEMEIFAEAVPSMTSPEGEWRSWMARKSRALETVRNRLQKGIVLPENQRASDERIQSYLANAAKIRGGSIYKDRNDAPGFDPETGAFRKDYQYVETEQTRAHLDKYSGTKGS